MDNWNTRCSNSIAKQKKEIEERYGIRIGQTEIYCSRCGKPWGYGRHTCFDVAMRKLQDEKKKNLETLKSQKAGLLDAIQREIGPKKASILLRLPESTVSKWIQRGTIPNKHLETVGQMLKSGL
jgi:hypothetical protein